MPHDCVARSSCRSRALILLVGLLSSTTPSRSAEPAGELAQRLADVKFELYAAAPEYSEGPSWRDGELFFCSDGLLRVDAKRTVHKYLDIGPAGTVLRADGHLLVCDNKYKALLDVAPDGIVRVVVEQFEGKPLRSLNDLTVDARGNVYWTDPDGSTAANPTGRVFRVRPDGRVDLVASGLAFPNGLDVDPQSKYLYLIESQSKKILRYELPADNRPLGKAEMFYDLGGSGGDGCVFDAKGNFWVADFHRPETGHGRITVLSPDARVLAYLPVPSKVVSNITFGGAKNDEIFCTTGDPPAVFHAAVGVEGFKGHPGKPLTFTRILNVPMLVPHADSEAVRRIAAVANAGKIEAGRFDDATRQQLQALIAGLTDPMVRADMQRLMVSLEHSALDRARDKALLAEIKRLKGTATLEVAAPDWLRSMAGDDGLQIFSRIVDIELNERTDGHKAPEPKALADRVTDDWLKNLSDQYGLQQLSLSGTAVTSAGMVHLKNLTNLERFSVCLTGVDDEGFQYLAGMTKMRRMTICASKITGSGFKHLQGMTKLVSINMHSTHASDEGLEAIGKLTSLQRLEIVHTHVTDAGLKHLATLVNLRELHVASHGTTEKGAEFLPNLKNLNELDLYEKLASNEGVEQVAKLPRLRVLRLIVGPLDDSGVKPLGTMSTLEELTLACGNITDAAIPHLAGLKELRKIDVHGTKITAAGRQKLKELLPEVEIAR